MSALVDAVATLVPIVDPRLSGSISSCANTPIPMEVALAMTDVIKAVADQMEKEGRVFRGLPISCIFTGSDSFTTRLDENQCAICVKLAVYPLPRLLRTAARSGFTQLWPKSCATSFGTSPMKRSSTLRFLKSCVIFIRN